MKRLSSIILTLIFALLVSTATGLNPYIVVPAFFALNTFVHIDKSAGVLYDLTAASTFDGTARSHILSLLVLGAETIQKGLIHTIPNKYDKISLPFVNTAPDQLQDRIPEPVVSADSVYTEKIIDPKDLMWYLEFLPQDFESVWADFWPRGAMVNQILDPKIMAAVLKTTRGSINTQLENNIWQGDVAAGGGSPIRFFDGFLKTMTADGTVVKVDIVAPIDETNIKDVLNEIITAMPPAVRTNKRPKFIVSHNTFDAFEQYTTDLDFKGQNVYDGTQLRYRGFTIVPVGGMTDNDIVFADATTGPDGNLFAGTWLENDRGNFLINKKQANAETWFIKAIFRYGVEYGNGPEIVLANHTPV